MAQAPSVKRPKGGFGNEAPYAKPIKNRAKFVKKHRAPKLVTQSSKKAAGWGNQG